MSKIENNLEIIAVLILCIFVLFNPYYVNNLYNTLSGRSVILIVLVLLTVNNMLYGLFFALSLIITLNFFFREGLENNSEMSNDETQIKEGDDIKEMNNNKQDEEEEDVVMNGVDIQSVEENIRPLNSKEVTVEKQEEDPNKEVMPSDPMTESFSCLGSIYM
jgi:hypothetical protein